MLKISGHNKFCCAQQNFGGETSPEFSPVARAWLRHQTQATEPTTCREPATRPHVADVCDSKEISYCLTKIASSFLKSRTCNLTEGCKWQFI